MLAALRLRWLEARRRGGGWLLALTALAIAAAALWGGATVDGRFGLATDLATLFTYALAVFFGAFPLAVDRERKRAYLPAASPATPVGWAFGNALAAALLTIVVGLVLFLAAGAAVAAGGGIDTYEVARVGNAAGTQWLAHPGADGARARPFGIVVPDDAHSLRFRPRVYVRAEDARGTAGFARVEVGGRPVEVVHDRTLVIPITPPRVEIRNVEPDYAVGIARDSIRALRAERPFLLNAVRAGAGTALAAGAMAALGVAAAAHVAAPVAALLVALLVLLGGLKAPVEESLADEARNAAAAAQEAAVAPRRANPAARAVVQGALAVVPDLAGASQTDRAAVGEWVSRRPMWNAALLCAAALAVAAAVGGAGVFRRRTA